jgi:hypothetical protein
LGPPPWPQGGGLISDCVASSASLRRPDLVVFLRLPPWERFFVHSALCKLPTRLGGGNGAMSGSIADDPRLKRTTPLKAIARRV